MRQMLRRRRRRRRRPPSKKFLLAPGQQTIHSRVITILYQDAIRNVMSNKQ